MRPISSDQASFEFRIYMDERLSSPASRGLTEASRSAAGVLSDPHSFRQNFTGGGDVKFDLID